MLKAKANTLTVKAGSQPPIAGSETTL